MTTNTNPLHPRNKHKGHYDFNALIEVHPALAPFVGENKYGTLSITFSDPLAVKALNTALLKLQYQVSFWDVPEGYLCPPIPGRADYIHNLADLMAVSNGGRIPTGKHIQVLDVGVGANCIYPILGAAEYQWSFLGSDIDADAIASAAHIANENPFLKDRLKLQLQASPNHIFRDVLLPGKRVDMTMCNPPFHASAEAAAAGNMRKLKNLNKKAVAKTALNFGGKQAELWCEGGEKRFIAQMINQSKHVGKSCLWFTSLVSREAHLDPIYYALENARAEAVKTIDMGQGNKISRFVAWTFQSPEEHRAWVRTRWNVEKE